MKDVASPLMLKKGLEYALGGRMAITFSDESTSFSFSGTVLGFTAVATFVPLVKSIIHLSVGEIRCLFEKDSTVVERILSLFQFANTVRDMRLPNNTIEAVTNFFSFIS